MAVAIFSKRIDGPLPAPPRYSLIQNAQIVDDPDTHWLGGGAVHTYPSLEDGAAHAGCAEGSDREKIEGGVIALPEFGAFTVYLAETCTARGIDTWEDFQDRANLAFTAIESALVEQEFSQGIVVPGNPYLMGPGFTALAGGAVDPVEAAGLLENAIATTGKAGMIHGDPGGITSLAAHNLVQKEGDFLRTMLGTLLVPGHGYLGMTPDGSGTIPDNESWLVATGPVQIRRTPLETNPPSVAEALDRTSNTITYRAERHYLVDWDTELQSGVLVDWDA